MASRRKRPERRMTAAQKRSAKASAKRHGRSRPGLWENVNASKGKGTRKGRTRPGRRSKTRKSGSAKRRARRRS